MICPECGHRSGIHAFRPGQGVLYGPYPATVLRIDEESDQVVIELDRYPGEEFWTQPGALRRQTIGETR